LISGIKVDRTNTIPSGDEFTDIVLKDESAKHVENAVVHREFHWFVQEALEQGVKRILILGAFGLGKCLVKGTEVLTYSGDSKKVENVKIGDLLMGDDNKPRKVLFLGSGVENSYKITLRNGDSFSCNESHILSFIVSNRVQGLQKGDRLEISVGDYLKLPEWIRKNCLKLYKVPLKFSYNRELPLRPYLYGLWLGDGHLSGLHFTINNKDTEIVTYLHRWAVMYGFQVREDEQKGECTRYDLTLGTSNSKKYDELNFLKQFRGHGKYIDRRYLINAKFVRLQVLAGLIDTDGYLCGDTCYEIATKYLRLRDDILFLCRSLGFHVSHRVKDVNGTNYYVIVIGGDIYQIPCRTRKKAPFKEKIKNPLVYGFDIECIGEQEYFGFGVDGNKRFLLKDFTVAHNTEQISIGYVLEQIARNTNIRIKIVSNTDDNAADRVRAIRTYIDGDEDYNRLAPHVKRTPVWGNSKFIVARKSASKDGTVEAYGIFGSATGGRADLIVFDDPQDLKTAVLEPIGREKCIEVISSVWLPRLVEHGVAIILMNRWHELDVANWVQMNPEWAWMSIGVSEDFMKLEVTKSIKGVKEKYKIHPWKEPAYFMQKRVDLGERAYNRGFRLIPYSDDEMYFPSFPKCCDFGEDRAFIIKRILKTRNCLVVCGIDYSSMKRPGIAMVTVIVDKKTERRYFAEVVALREPARLMQHMVRVRREYGVDLFMAENNATQELVTELLSTFTGLRSARIEGFHTGKNKADPELGLSSLENEFEKRMWKFIFPEEPKIENEKTDVYTRAYFEIKEYPFWTTTDIVMALWFCRQGIDLLMRKRLIPVIY